MQVFLSYNREDSEAVEEVARRLRRDGIEPWFDRWSAAPGQAWQVQIAEALGAVSACAVFVGPHGLGGWAREELAVAQDRVSRDRGFRLFMVLLPGATDPQDPALAFLSQRTWVDLRQGIRTADGHRELLRAITGLGTMPSPEVSPLHERLLEGKAIDEPAPAPRRDQEGARGSPQRGQDIGLPHFGGARATQAFVGRRDELARLHALWPTGSEGEPMLLVLQGKAGVGKSWLASRFAAETHREGAFVLYGRCEAEAIVPYQPFVEALRHGLREMPPAADSGLAVELAALGALIPDARTLAGESSQPPDRDPERERYHLFEAVTRLLGHWAADRPVLLVIDDLQWADKPTLLMLRHVARRQEHHLVAILATLRSDEAQSPALAKILNDLGREPGVNRVTMEGLAEPDAAELAASRLAAPQPAAFVRALRADTGGNPLFMSEILRVLAPTIKSGGVASPKALERVPQGVVQVIASRLPPEKTLPSEALDVASVIGREFDLDAVAALLDQPADDVIGALEEAVHAGLVVELQDRLDRFAFCHDLVRRAIYQRMSWSRQARWHLRVGKALERMEREAGRAVEPAELARHFRLARPLAGSERAVHHAQRAGAKAARALAYEEAASHYRDALDAWPSGDRSEETRCDVLLALGKVCSRAGASQRARDAFEEAVDSARRRSAARQLARAALGLGERYWQANVADQQYGRLLQEALDALQALDEGDDALRARVLARLAANLHFTAHQRRGIEHSAHAVAIARLLPGKKDLVFALLARHVALLHIDYVEERLEILEEVLLLSGGWREMSAEAHQWRLYDLCELGRIEEARVAHADLVVLSNELRQPLFQYVAHAWQGVFALLDGEVYEAERLAYESHEFGVRAQASDADSVRGGKLFMLRRWQGRADEMLGTIERLGEAPAPLAPWRAALALTRLEAGDRERGRESFDALAAEDFAAVPRDFFWLTTVALLSEACNVLGDAARANVLYQRLWPFADRVVQVSFAACWGSVQRYLGLLKATMGDAEAADAHFEQALLVNRAIKSPPLIAATAYDHARLLQDAPGDQRRARELAAEAEAIAGRHGLTALRRRAAALQP